MTTSKLIAELKALEARRAEIEASADAARAAHAVAQDGLLKGTGQVSDVTTAHGNLIAITSALSVLDAKINEARETVRREAERQAAREKEEHRAEIHAEYKRLVTDYRGAWKQLDETLKQSTAHMTEMCSRWAELTREESRLDGGKDTGMQPLDFVAVRAHSLNLEFGPVISAALLSHWHRSQREADADRQRKASILRTTKEYERRTAKQERAA